MTESPLQDDGRPRHARAVLTIVGLLVLLYLPTVGFEFLNWDDPWYVLDSELIRSWSPSNLYRIVAEPATKNYAPLTTLSLLIDHTIWGFHPGGYHLTNLLLHVVNATLVYVLIWRLTGSRVTSWLTAVLFAVHPVQVESVAWISSRKGLLSSAFILATLICWLRPQREPKHEGYALLFLFLALMAKAIAVVVPAVMLTYDVWIARKKLSDSIARIFPAGTVAVVILLLTISAQDTMYGGVRGHMALSKLHILAVDSIILWRYVGMLIWPASLSVMYDPPTEGIAVAVVISTLAWAAVIAVLYRLRHRFPVAVWAMMTAFLFLVPVLNFTPITTLMNDRYLYLPCIPLFALFAAGLRRLMLSAKHRLETRWSSVKVERFTELAALAVVGVILTALTVRTHFYLPVWRDSRSLWEHAATQTPDLPLVQYQLADAFFESGQRDRAIRLLEDAAKSERTDPADRTRFAETLAEWRVAEVRGQRSDVRKQIPSLTSGR